VSDAVDRARWDRLAARIAELGALVWGTTGSGEPSGAPGDDGPSGDDERVRGGGRSPADAVTAEGARYLLRFLAAGIRICVEHDDTEAPAFCHSIEDRMSWGLDNPDCNYSYTRLTGDGTYRVSGTRGTARHLELQVNTGHHGDGDFTGWRAVSTLTGDDLPVGEDGSFEVVLSAREHPGAWMRLDDDASFLLVRQYFADWETEQPATLAIERLDRPLPAAPLDTPTLARRLDLLEQWLDVGARCWDGLSRGLLAAPPGPVTPFLPPAEASGLKGQAYGMGSWRCEPDEAVVLHLDPPACRMWGVSLCDRYWQSIDFADRQSSLNSHQAVPDTDGGVTFVITHDDPGVANWLDPGGHREGTLAVRYLFPDRVPTLDYRTVARDALAGTLPEGVAPITPAARRDVLARRHRAVARRYRH
jgi:hypothetical protein